MNTKPEQSSEQSKKLLAFLGNKLFQIENFYLIYSELGLHYNKTVSSDSSRAYLEVINSHKGFFLPVQEALRETLTIELSSFIVSKDSKSMRAAIELLSMDDGPDLLPEYERLKKKNSNIMLHLEKFRNQYYAHKSNTNLTKLPPSSDKEFQDLFDDIKVLLNKASAYYGNTFWYMKDNARESVNDTHDLMNCLLRGESQRKSEIDVEYMSETYKDGKKKWVNQ